MDLNYLIPFEIVTKIIDKIFFEIFKIEDDKVVDDIYLNYDDIKMLIDDGNKIGLHGHLHKVLPRMDYIDQFEDLQKNKTFIKNLIHNDDLAIAYPQGFFNHETERVNKELGLIGGFTMGREILNGQLLKEKWQIPRFDVNDCFNGATCSLNENIFA